VPRALIASMILWCFFSNHPTDSRAQNPPKQDSTYRAGLACFDQLDFSCAIELLGAAAKSGATDKNRLVDIYRKLAESHLALGQRKEAVLDFIDLLEIEPAYDITSVGVSPKIIDALDQARQRIKKDKPIPVEPPSKPAGIEFGLTAGAELLIGDDKRLLKTGPVFEIEGNFVVSGPWRAGFGLRYTFHELSENSSSLHLGGAWASFGGDWQLGSVHLAALAGLGVAYFGIPNEEGKTNLVIPLRFSAGLSIGSGIQLGLVLEPNWLLSLDDSLKSSFTFCLGGRLLVAF
jgi:tetratricopeptide (TPR) repeat protein